MNKNNRISTTDYTVSFDGDYMESFITLRKARDWIRSYSLRADIKEFPDVVTLRKRTVVESILNEYRSQHKKVLVAGELELDAE